MRCRKLEKEIVGDEWALGKMTVLSAEDFWTWVKTDTTGYDGHDYLVRDKCVDFERELWFKLVKCMRRKHLSVYQDHMKYAHNDIVKPFKDKIICYAERVCEMHDLSNYLPPHSIKGDSAMAANCNVHNEKFTASDIRLAIKHGIPKFMRDELDDPLEHYCSLTYEDWCDFLSKIKVKNERKREAAYIKSISSAREAPFSGSNEYVKHLRKKKTKTGVLQYKKSPNKAHRHHSIHHYCVIFKKAVITLHK